MIPDQPPPALIAQETKDKLLAMATLQGGLLDFEHKGKAFYFLPNDDENRNVEIDSFEDGVYFSFALKNRIIAASSDAQLKALLDNRGKLPKRRDAKGALIVLTAEKSLIQAGMQADQIDGDGGWQSNILRNTDQVALMVADVAGKIALETQLIAKQPEMAESLASIVRGLISLTMFSEDMNPTVSKFLQDTTVDVDGSSLKIRVALDPEAVVAALDD